MQLYTKNGRALQRFGDLLYTGGGTAIGRVNGNLVHGLEGQYLGTLDGDRLVFRRRESAGIDSAFSAPKRSAVSVADIVVADIGGEEPGILE